MLIFLDHFRAKKRMKRFVHGTGFYQTWFSLLYLTLAIRSTDYLSIINVKLSPKVTEGCIHFLLYFGHLSRKHQLLQKSLWTLFLLFHPFEYRIIRFQLVREKNEYIKIKEHFLYPKMSISIKDISLTYFFWNGL